MTSTEYKLPLKRWRTENLLRFRLSALEMFDRATHPKDQEFWGKMSLFYKGLLDKME